MDIFVTSIAAEVASQLTPKVLDTVRAFLRDKVVAYTKEHEPHEIKGLEGKYWVVRPSDGADVPALVLTTTKSDDPAEAGGVVLTALIPTSPIDQSLLKDPVDPADFAIGADLLRAVESA